eukprot:m.294514 g.294514  ORF g.294514 m.294514 type:complete len:67 (+) comp13003_c0_seq1:136-336(+)
MSAGRAAYREFLRLCDRLPVEARNHYRNAVRNSFMSFRDETDPVRIQQIIQRAREDAQWIIKKYSS